MMDRDKLIEAAKVFYANNVGEDNYSRSIQQWMTDFASEQIAAAVKAERERIAGKMEQFVWKHNNDERHVGVEPCQICEMCDELCEIYTELRGGEL